MSGAAPRVQVALADDQALVRAGLRALLQVTLDYLHDAGGPG